MSLFSKPKNGNGSNNGHIIDLRDVHKYYKTAVGDYHALKSIDLQINPGEFVSIIGKSGSGKSTLLNMITGGSFASARAIATRCCCPPERAVGSL